MKLRKSETARSEYNPKMITLAREARNMTLSELSEKVETDLSKIENGITIPMRDLISKISNVLHFPLSFFKQPDTILNLDAYYYRKKLNISKKELLKSEADINITKINIERLLVLIKLDDPNYPHFNIETDGTPMEAAIQARKFWNIEKIGNLTTLLEDNGILVIPLDFEGVPVDGLSILTEKNTPIIFVNQAIPADRTRLTLAHELGHLVMHIGKEISPERDVEKEAFLFAAELLMPEEQIRGQLKNLTIDKLSVLKTQWKVSMAALIQRALHLGTITDKQHKTLWHEMGKLGYKTREPQELDFPKEEPLILKQILGIHLKEFETTKKELAKFLSLSYPEFAKKYLVRV
jgi:Zn-dependent peptidase ImmA (M78 family)/transcriptional regulator with XRE-family HTH domain